jgi:hypothetical protein
MPHAEIEKRKIQRSDRTILIEAVKICAESQQLPPCYLILSDQKIKIVDQSQDLSQTESENGKLMYQFILKKIKISPMMSPKVFSIDDSRQKIEVSCETVAVVRRILSSIEVSSLISISVIFIIVRGSSTAAVIKETQSRQTPSLPNSSKDSARSKLILQLLKTSLPPQSVNTNPHFLYLL